MERRGAEAGGAADTLLRYLVGAQAQAQARRTPEEAERADERKRRLQRERSRRYRAAKQARRGRAPDRDEPYEPYFERGEARREPRPPARRDPPAGDSPSEGEEPPTLCKRRGEAARETSSDSLSDDNSTPGFPETLPLPKNISINLKEFLSIPNHELDYSTVHSLMFHWLQT